MQIVCSRFACVTVGTVVALALGFVFAHRIGCTMALNGYV